MKSAPRPIMTDEDLIRHAAMDIFCGLCGSFEAQYSPDGQRLMKAIMFAYKSGDMKKVTELSDQLIALEDDNWACFFLPVS